ncbi:6-phosphogluconolactonase [Legionella norrlandica]|uniref:6-phosphogluconolactonase n=1 Tax=Legionella norrlandica TaxID=1498499 RepID=A0A0A2SUC8_9GAMM|nr:6-phosphogluconolactonase [Legionella norrlandica]KGP63029.1 6-phosphogluconolactonase [Legionella norrlandica]
MQLYSFTDANQLTHEMAEKLKTILSNAIKLRGKAYLVVSGGKTPIDLFKKLALADLPWEKIVITLADERCVGLAASQRNERLICDFLLQHKAKNAKFISLYDEKVDLLTHLQTVDRLIDSLPTFDAVILGMGEDGHTASLFPCSDELSAGLDDKAKAILLVNPRTAPFQRISLSKRRLLDSHNIFLHLLGQRKRSVLEQAMRNNKPAIMPVCAVLHNSKANVQVMYAPADEEKECTL